MPTITVEGPLIDVEKKRRLGRGLAETAAAVYGLPVDKIVVLIKENQPENVYTGGELLFDRWKKEKK